MEERVADDGRRDPPGEVRERGDGESAAGDLELPARGRATGVRTASRRTPVAAMTAAITAVSVSPSRYAAASGGAQTASESAAATGAAPARPRSASRPTARRAHHPGATRTSPAAAQTARASHASARPAARHAASATRAISSARRAAIAAACYRPLSHPVDSIPAILRRSTTRGAHASLDPGRRRLSRLADRHAVLGQGPRGGRRRQLCPQEVGGGGRRRLADPDRLPGRADRRMARRVRQADRELRRRSGRGHLRRRPGARLRARGDHPLRRAAQRSVVDAEHRQRRRDPAQQRHRLAQAAVGRCATTRPTPT